MATRLISQAWRVEGVLTNVTTAKLSDPTGTFGVKRNDTSAVVVADGTNMTNSSTGVYQYSFDDVAGVAYTAYVEIVYLGSTYYLEVDIPARASGEVTSYFTLLERVGKYLYGIRSGFSADQTLDIKDCINDGLRRVYSAYDWSFLHPVADVTTTAPYATGTITIAAGVVTLTGGTWPSWAAAGVLKADNRYYSVASRDSNTQITLDTTSITIATASSYQLARPEIPLDAAFDAVANDSDLAFYPTPDRWYPPVQWRHDSTIRQLEGNKPDFATPVFYSVRTSTFDPTVGSRKVLVLYPTPNQAYTLRVPMILRPVLLDETNLYPIGGEVLSQVILEACLAAAEHNFEEREHVHEKQFQELIGMAIRDDQERSTPTSLGPDAPRDEPGKFLINDYARRSREQRIGSVSIDGITQ